jgi:WD40 repeat protein
VRLWQIAPGPDQFKVVRLWYDKAAAQYLSVRWSPDGRRLLASDRAGRVAEWSFDPIVDRWDAATIAAFAKMGFKGHPYWFGQHAALLAPKLLWSEGGHKQMWNARYSPDGNRVAAAGTDGVLSVYEARTGRVLYRTSAPKPTAFHGLDWSPDGTLIAAGAADRSIYVFTAATGSLYDTLVGHRNLVTAVAWSPNGRTLASTAGGQRVAVANNQVSQGPDDAVHLWIRR